jgi:Tol biopolymer transport system component
MLKRARAGVLGSAVVGSSLAMGCGSSTTPTSVTPPPPVKVAIVFDMLATGSQGNRNIYVEALDGTGLLQLTSDSADHHAPSANKTAVFFASTRPVGNVVAHVPSGGGPTDLLAMLGTADEPAVSPDGSMLAFLTTTTPLPRVYTSLIDGSQAARLSAAEAGWDGAVEDHPTWSPTGDRIAYVSTRSGNPGIYVAAVGGAAGSAALLTISPSGASVEPAWSPDGTQIVFTSNRDGPTDLYIATVTTGAVARLTSLGHVGQATWLADGRIVFTQWVAGTAGLAWLDPSAPVVIHPLATPGDAQRAASSQ